MEPVEIGLCGTDSGGGCSSLIHEGVGILAGDSVGFDQVGVAISLNAGVVGVGLRGGQVGLRLGQLLVYFRRRDLGEQRAFPYLRTDVKIPLRQITGGPGVDGRICQRGDVAGEYKAVHRRAGFGGCNQHGGRGQLSGGIGQHLIGAQPAPDAIARQCGGDSQDNHYAGQRRAWPNRRLLRRCFVIFNCVNFRLVFVSPRLWLVTPSFVFVTHGCGSPENLLQD